MSSVLRPAAPPEPDTGDSNPPPEQPALPPESDDVTPPPAPPLVQIPIPSVSSPLAAPLLPIVVGTTPPPTSALPPLPATTTPSTAPPWVTTTTPTIAPPPVTTTTPTIAPVSSLPQPQPQPQVPQPQPQPQPLPHPQPQPSVSSPTPTTENNPPPKNVTPPKFSPPTNKPVNVTPAPFTRSSSNNINKPTTPTSPSQPLLAPTRPAAGKPETRPSTKPTPFKPSPSSRPKTNTSPASAVSASAPVVHSPDLPDTAVLPSSPPVSLPVPQTPTGGAWFPSTSPAALPTLPSPRGGALDSPATPFVGGNSGDGLPSSASVGPAAGADHQNIQAAASSNSSASNGSSMLAVGLVVGGVLLLLLGIVCVIMVLFCRRKQKKSGDPVSGKLQGSAFSGAPDKSSLPLYTKQGFNPPVNVNTPQGSSALTSATAMAKVGSSPGIGKQLSSGTFTYEELSAATNGFSEQNLLGQGGFGYVHKGVFPNGKEVAVKKLKMGGDQGEREFQAEVETISQVHHKHLVSLVGYCIAGPERLLVYEFVLNDTLDFHLHGKGQPVMDWPTRLKIAIGAAKGLAYLHEDCSPTIIHRDIKASNILLDLNFEAKVSDFGLAKIFSSTNPSITHMTTRVVGTFGYLAPEYASSGKVTDKSDVYSYGVVLLELITGRPPISNFGCGTNGSLVDWARPQLAQAIAEGSFDTLADSRLQNNYNVDEMANMVACAAACVRLSSWRRPRLSQVIRALEGNLSASELDDGIRPGHSGMHFPYESLDFDARNYMEDLKNLVLTSNNGNTSRYSENTSEFGLNPSVSSTDSSQHMR